MAIKSIKVTNFKSFKNLDVKLGDLNILIGANAAGKSNFADIFRFLRDIENSNLRRAIDKQGGFENLRNLKAEPDEPLFLEVVSEREFLIPRSRAGKRIRIEIYETTYKCSIIPQDDELGFRIDEECLRYKCRFREFGESVEEIKKSYGEGEIILSHTDGMVDFRVDIDKGMPIEKWDIVPLDSWEMASRDAILESSIRFFFFNPLPSDKIFGDIPVYDFNPSSIIKPPLTTVIGGLLEEDGRNLAMTLKSIMESEDGKRKLLNLVTYPLPFIEDLNVERGYIDKAFLLNLREKYSEKFLPAKLVSGGTINVIALVVALYFEEQPLAIFEELDRGIHPYLISKIVHMMEDASENKQIIVTTHNPEVVKHAEAKDILLVTRNENGFSSIVRPSRKKDVKIFLDNGLRMEDLYVDSLLEI